MDISASKLAEALMALPAGATLTDDPEYGKLDVFLGKHWIGGLWVRGDNAGEFYSAESVQ